jgi:hypothetical protein
MARGGACRRPGVARSVHRPDDRAGAGPSKPLLNDPNEVRGIAQANHVANRAGRGPLSVCLPRPTAGPHVLDRCSQHNQIVRAGRLRCFAAPLLNGPGVGPPTSPADGQLANDYRRRSVLPDRHRPADPHDWRTQDAPPCSVRHRPHRGSCGSAAAFTDGGDDQ